MTNIESNSLEIFEDMKSGLFERDYDEDDLTIEEMRASLFKRDYDEDDLTITEDEPLRFELQISTSTIEGSSKATLWAQYLPSHHQVFVGVKFPEQIPIKKIPFTLTLLNGLNNKFSWQHSTFCPICRRIDTVSGISITGSRLPKKKYHLMLCVSQANAEFYDEIIWKITRDEYDVKKLISIAYETFPDLEEYLRGQS
jgi:hypothetical protein